MTNAPAPAPAPASASASASPVASVRRASLTRQLLLWSLGALALVWASFVLIGYQTGVHEADELTDGHLASVAALLLNLRASEAMEEPQITPRAATPGSSRTTTSSR